MQEDGAVEDSKNRAKGGIAVRLDLSGGGTQQGTRMRAHSRPGQVRIIRSSPSNLAIDPPLKNFYTSGKRQKRAQRSTAKK